MRMPKTIKSLLLRYAYRRMAGKPDEVIHRSDMPYLERYYIVKSRILTVYLHKFTAPDRDPDPHDHPWDFVSFILSGAYDEDIYHIRGLAVGCSRVRRKSGDIVFRRAEFVHRIASLDPDVNGVITIVVCGPRRRRWGFWRGVECVSSDDAPHLPVSSPVWVDNEVYHDTKDGR